MTLASDIAVILGDFGVPIQVGAKKAKALVDSADELLLANGTSPVLGRNIIATILTHSVQVEPGTLLQLNGVAYKASEVYQVDDGALTRIHCAKLN